MYYKHINRGLSFTKPGIYMVGLIFAIGVIAIISGVNGMFLFLGLGLGILITSGLLSEKTIKDFELLAIAEAQSDANTPFKMQLSIANRSGNFAIFGVENILLIERPKFRLLSAKIDSQFAHPVLKLAPASTEQCIGRCSGLPRGVYRELIMMQRTNYPFGLIEKFKLSQINTNIVVLPVFDEPLAKKLRVDLRQRMSLEHTDFEFHSHRSYMHRDSLKYVDWRKSAGLQESDWVIKQFESQREIFGVLIVVDWDAGMAVDREEDYEKFLAGVRTACDVLYEGSQNVGIQFVGRGIVSGIEPSMATLAGLPKWHERHVAIVIPPETEEPQNTVYRLQMAPAGYRWIDSHEKAS